MIKLPQDVFGHHPSRKELRKIHTGSLRIIGLFFDRDHSTILSGIRRVDKLIAADDEFAARIARLLDRLQNRDRRAA